MPYAHKTSQPTKNALRRGDLVFAVGGGQNLGPTSATGYYNTISPPVNGYAIYSLGLNNNPIGMAVTTDDEIIKAANTLGGSVSSKSDALFYLANRSSTWVLQFNNMPINIVTNGLVLDLNASIVSSYPGSGTTWLDLSGENNDTTISSADFNSGGGYFQSVGNAPDSLIFSTPDSTTISNTFSVTSGGWTIEEFIRIDDTTYPEAAAGTVVSGRAYGTNATGFDWNHGVMSGTSLNIDMSNLNTGGGATRDAEVNLAIDPEFQTYGQWFLRSIYWDRTNDKCGVYYNGVFQDSGSISGVSGYSLYDGGGISWGTLYGWHHDGARSSMRVYNRVLSSTEVLRNYNAYLGSYIRPADSAQQIMDNNPEAKDGNYWINTDLGPQLLYCILDPTIQGGGWMGVNENIAPYTGNVATTAVWEDNNNYLESSNTSVLNVTIQEIGCSGTSYYQLGNPSDHGVDYNEVMMLMYRVSTIGQCSRIGGGTAYYEGPKYTGDHTSSGMCTWNNGIFANGSSSDMTGLKKYWVLFASGANRDLEYSTRCASGTGTHYHMWFVK